MSRFFLAHLALEYQNNNENFINYIKPCIEIFDDSNYIRSQLALSNYHTRGMFLIFYKIFYFKYYNYNRNN